MAALSIAPSLIVLCGSLGAKDSCSGIRHGLAGAGLGAADVGCIDHMDCRSVRPGR